MKRQEYLDLRKKHQKELSDFPIAYAFNERQLEEALEKLGASKDECVTIFGHGDVVKTKDAQAFIDMLDRQRDELMRHILDDLEFAEAAFLEEMDNHEYAINYSGDEDVLGCFDLTFEKLNRYGLYHAWISARNQHMKNAEKWGMI